MSARQLAAPDRSFTSVLSEMSRRLGMLETRSSWVSSVQTETIAGGGGLPFTPTEDRDAPTFPVGTVAITMDLDPGRWVLFAQVTQRTTGVGDPPDPTETVEVGARLTWAEDSPGSATGSRSVGTESPIDDGTSYDASLALALETDPSEHPLTVTLTLFCGTDASAVSDVEYRVLQAAVVAFPG